MQAWRKKNSIFLWKIKSVSGCHGNTLCHFNRIFDRKRLNWIGEHAALTIKHTRWRDVLLFTRKQKLYQWVIHNARRDQISFNYPIQHGQKVLLMIGPVFILLGGHCDSQLGQKSCCWLTYYLFHVKTAFQTIHQNTIWRMVTVLLFQFRIYQFSEICLYILKISEYTVCTRCIECDTILI